MKHVTLLFLYFLHLIEHKTYPPELFNNYPYDFLAKRDFLYVINWKVETKRTKLTNSILRRLLEFNASPETNYRYEYVAVVYNIAALIKVEQNAEFRNELLEMLYDSSKNYWFFPELHGILADCEIVKIQTKSRKSKN